MLRQTPTADILIFDNIKLTTINWNTPNYSNISFAFQQSGNYVANQKLFNILNKKKKCCDLRVI